MNIAQTIKSLFVTPVAYEVRDTLKHFPSQVSCDDYRIYSQCDLNNEMGGWAVWIANGFLGCEVRDVWAIKREMWGLDSTLPPRLGVVGKWIVWKECKRILKENK